MAQITHAARHHQLTNIHSWTPDSQWLVFDVRPCGASFTGQTIERVNIHSKEVQVLYRAPAQSHVGVVTVNPQPPERYVFIHGPEHPDADWHYDFHHRRGVVLEGGQLTGLDAMDITAPYTPGALRGGSHVHVWSPDGALVSFTYNDHVLHERDPALDLRNVGVAVPCGPVTPGGHHPREYSGSHWCVLVSETTPTPRPGSDEICRAYEEGWVGEQGYTRAPGEHPRRALAFIGDTLSVNGEKVPELFIVDLPDSEAGWKQAGAFPLQGTPDRMPAPPAGVVQRRLTFTHQRRYPGLVTSPRHWVRSSPSAEWIACLMKDDQGVVQLWLVSPLGGEPRQLTHGTRGVESAINWHPSGRCLGFVQQGRVVLCDARSGEIIPLSPAGETPVSGDAVVFSPDGQYVAWMQEAGGFRQLFTARTGL